MSEIKPCNRCGACCEQGGPCDIRGWYLLDASAVHFEGTCDLLRHDKDGTTCLGIECAFENSKKWHEPTRIWLTTKFVGCGCEYVRKQVNGD